MFVKIVETLLAYLLITCQSRCISFWVQNRTKKNICEFMSSIVDLTVSYFLLNFSMHFVQRTRHNQLLTSLELNKSIKLYFDLNRIMIPISRERVENWTAKRQNFVIQIHPLKSLKDSLGWNQYSRPVFLNLRDAESFLPGLEMI